MGVPGEDLEPYVIRFAPRAEGQAAALSDAARGRLDRQLAQLAELAVFAKGYSLELSSLGPLVADVQGLSIEYEVDDTARTLTVVEITEPWSSPEDTADGIE